MFLRTGVTANSAKTPWNTKKMYTHLIFVTLCSDKNTVLLVCNCTNINDRNSFYYWVCLRTVFFLCEYINNETTVSLLFLCILYTINSMFSELFLSRIMWLTLVLGVTALFVYYFTERFTYFLKFPRQVDVEVIFNDTIEFPAVTICNQNRFRYCNILYH